MKERAVTTRENLLTAAGDVFLVKGFRDATVAEICKRAGANIAAVNYYFGSKEALYQEAWRHFFAESSKAHPQDGGVAGTAPAEERLRGQMKALIRRIADVKNKDFFISQMEFVNPTGLLALVMQSEFIPLREKTLAVLRELLGADVSEEQVVCCETCIISLCIHPVLMQRAHQRIAATEAPYVITDLEAFAEQVVTFALAGIAAIKAGAGAVGLAVQPPRSNTL